MIMNSTFCVVWAGQGRKWRGGRMGNCPSSFRWPVTPLYLINVEDGINEEGRQNGGTKSMETISKIPIFFNSSPIYTNYSMVKLRRLGSKCVEM